MGYGFIIRKKNIKGDDLFEQYKENGEVYITSSIAEVKAKLDEITMEHAVKYVKVIQDIDSTLSSTIADKMGNGSVDPILSDAEVDAIFNAAHKSVYGN